MGIFTSLRHILTYRSASYALSTLTTMSISNNMAGTPAWLPPTIMADERIDLYTGESRMQIVDRETVTRVLAHFGASIADFFETHGNSGFYDSRDLEEYLGISLG